MNSNTWHKLLALESVDIVTEWHKIIVSRELSARRAYEITAASRQSREFFRNAANADNTVRSLLTFYGVSSLARATALLMKHSGEESLKPSHGLEVVKWSNLLMGDVPVALSAIGDLRVRTTTGLFTDYLKSTHNRICLHTQSSNVDCRIDYNQPPKTSEYSLNDLLTRIPDLADTLSQSSQQNRFAAIDSFSYTDEQGFSAKIKETKHAVFQKKYPELGYAIETNPQSMVLKAKSETFKRSCPLFIHTYVHKMFGVIPQLHIAEPFVGDSQLSQLAITYMLSYFLGMLTRYYPTQWIALQNASRGDRLWPVVHAAQEYVELAFPELTIEFIHDALRHGFSIDT